MQWPLNPIELVDQVTNLNYPPSLKRFVMPPEPNRIVVDQVTTQNYAPSLKKFVMPPEPNRVVVDQVTTQMPPVSKVCNAPRTQ